MYRDDLFSLQQFMGGSGQWSTVALIVGIFFVIAFKREAIESVNLFRFGIFVLGVSMALSSFLPMLGLFSSRSQTFDWGSLLLTSGGAILNAVGFVCVVFSMLPKTKSKYTSVKAVPSKHPLDD